MLHKHAPKNPNFFRGNPHVNKTLRKAIKKRSQFKKKQLKRKTLKIF